jgi:hypothetical protein
MLYSLKQLTSVYIRIYIYYSNTCRLAANGNDIESNKEISSVEPFAAAPPRNRQQLYILETFFGACCFLICFLFSALRAVCVCVCILPAFSLTSQQKTHTHKVNQLL